MHSCRVFPKYFQLYPQWSVVRQNEEEITQFAFIITFYLFSFILCCFFSLIAALVSPCAIFFFCLLLSVLNGMCIHLYHPVLLRWICSLLCLSFLSFQASGSWEQEETVEGPLNSGGKALDKFSVNLFFADTIKSTFKWLLCSR